MLIKMQDKEWLKFNIDADIDFTVVVPLLNSCKQMKFGMQCTRVRFNTGGQHRLKIDYADGRQWDIGFAAKAIDPPIRYFMVNTDEFLRSQINKYISPVIDATIDLWVTHDIDKFLIEST